MIAFTIGQNQALADHVEWCKQIIDENTRDISLFSDGTMRVGEKTAAGDKDLTAAWIKRLKEHNETLNRIVKALEPAGFQKQVSI